LRISGFITHRLTSFNQHSRNFVAATVTMANRILITFSAFMAVLNRMLAALDFAVHYTSGYVLYYVFRGLKPQTHTKPAKRKDGSIYSPSVLVTGASEGKPWPSTMAR
jgi:zinc transporter ZupT